MNKKRGVSIVMIILGIIIIGLVITLIVITLTKGEKETNISSIKNEIIEYRNELKKATDSVSDLSGFDYSGTEILEYIPSMRSKKIDGMDEIYLFSIEDGKLSMSNTSKLLENVEIEVLKASEPELYTEPGFYDLDGNMLYSWNELLINKDLDMDSKAITKFSLDKEGVLCVLDGITEIASDAFENAKKLKGIQLPKSITLFDADVFSDCESLENINVSKDNLYYSSLDGVLYSKETTKLVRYPSGRKGAYTPVRTITTIGKNAFTNSKYLTEINLPVSLIQISSSAFEGCSKLTEVSIPLNVTDVGNNAFASCTSLTSASFSGDVKEIEHDTFSGCLKLSDVTLPQNLKVIGKNAFEECKSIKQIELPATLTEIMDEAFLKCTSLIAINIPNTVTSIGEGAFRICESLEKVILSDNITVLNDKTFEDCKSLKDITIPERVANIGKSVFSNCTSIPVLEVPYSVNKIGENAFKNVRKIIYTGTAIGSPWGAKSK